MSRKFRALMTGWATVAILAGAFPAVGEVIEDDFADGSIEAPPWTTSSSGTASIEEADGVLKLSATAGDPGGESGLYGTLHFEGDLDVQADYDWIAYDDTRDARTVLTIVSNEHKARANVGFHRWGAALSREIIFSYYEGQTGGNVGSISGAAAPLTGKLRIRRQGTAFYGYYWSGTIWQSLGSTAGYVGPGHPVIYANNATNPPHTPQYPAFEVHWDNFHAQADRILARLILTVKHPEWGAVTVEPNTLYYRDPNENVDYYYFDPNAVVTLTADPCESKTWMGWQGDVDPNHNFTNPIDLTMETSKEIDVAFKCGFGVGPILPVILATLALFGCLGRKRN